MYDSQCTWLCILVWRSCLLILCDLCDVYTFDLSFRIIVYLVRFMLIIWISIDMLKSVIKPSKIVYS